MASLTSVFRSWLEGSFSLSIFHFSVSFRFVSWLAEAICSCNCAVRAHFDLGFVWMLVNGLQLGKHVWLLGRAVRDGTRLLFCRLIKLLEHWTILLLLLLLRMGVVVVVVVVVAVASAAVIYRMDVLPLLSTDGFRCEHGVSPCLPVPTLLTVRT